MDNQDDWQQDAAAEAKLRDAIDRVRDAIDCTRDAIGTPMDRIDEYLRLLGVAYEERGIHRVRRFIVTHAGMQRKDAERLTLPEAERILRHLCVERGLLPADEWRPTAWYVNLTKHAGGGGSGIYADLLGTARRDGRLREPQDARKVGKAWQYRIAAACNLWPQYAAMIRAEVAKDSQAKPSVSKD